MRSCWLQRDQGRFGEMIGGMRGVVMYSVPYRGMEGLGAISDSFYDGTGYDQYS